MYDILYHNINVMGKKVYKVEIQSTIYQAQSTKPSNPYTGRPQKFFSELQEN